PFLSGVLRGYKRGETYRFGIVFYNKKGESSFVKYIGDIKFPDISEQDGAANDTGTNYWITATDEGVSGSSHITKAYALGVQFSIDFSSCPQLFQNIESYQIVRVERENTDKRRICSGIMRVYTRIPIGSPDGTFDLRGPGNSEDVLHIMTHQNLDTDTERTESEIHAFSHIETTIAEDKPNNIY